MSGCFASATGLELRAELIAEAVAQKRLLSMEIELSRDCNPRCALCDGVESEGANRELTSQESRDVILQAKALGARTITILGGEPMIHRGIFDLIEFIREQGLGVALFTNGANVAADTAQRLFENRVNLALEMDAFTPMVQRLRAQEEDASLAIEALRNLKEAGYPSDEASLAISTRICRHNMSEMVDLWQWLRDQGLLPYLEMMPPKGAAPASQQSDVEPGKLHDLFDEIARIDAEKYGRIWEPQPPLVGHACLRHGFSCLVGATGNVTPCVGLPIVLGNVRRDSLRRILEDSEVLEDLRNATRTIKGPCSECDKAGHCYGCRGTAYNLTGDYLASDPTCWRNADRRDEILTLPVAVEGLIPHQAPMCLIDTLLSVGERSARTSVRVTGEMPFVDTDGLLDECACIEMIAQSIAAMAGFRRAGRGTPQIGMLVGAKDLRIEGPVHVGDLLEISVYKTARFGEIGVVAGIVQRDGTVIARGEIKVWENAASDAARA